MEDWAGEGRERNLKHSFLSPDSNFVNLSGNFKLLFFGKGIFLITMLTAEGNGLAWLTSFSSYY